MKAKNEPPKRREKVEELTEIQESYSPKFADNRQSPIQKTPEVHMDINSPIDGDMDSSCNKAGNMTKDKSKSTLMRCKWHLSNNL